MIKIATRTPQECRELADRQAAGEDLGFSDAFVMQWASNPPSEPAAKPEAPAEAPPSAEASAEAEPQAPPPSAKKAGKAAKAG